MCGKLPHIDYTLTTIGDDPQQTPNEAKIYVRMTPLKGRKLSQFDVMAQVREKVLPKYAPLNLRPVGFDSCGDRGQQPSEREYRLHHPGPGSGQAQPVFAGSAQPAQGDAGCGRRRYFADLWQA
jgi:hypothetical protein